MDKSTIDQLNRREIVRIDYHNSVWNEKRSLTVAVDAIEKEEDKTIIEFVDKWGEPTGPKLVADITETKLTESTMQDGLVNSIRVVGELSPDSGSHHILLRPPPHRDHILQKSDSGVYRNVCKHNVDVSDGEKIRADEVTPRQRSLMNLCADCHSQLQGNPTLDLPERQSQEEFDQGPTFYCPHCGETPEHVEYVKMLNGMVSHHSDDRRCGPWPEHHYLKWRVEGVSPDRYPSSKE